MELVLQNFGVSCVSFKFVAKDDICSFHKFSCALMLSANNVFSPSALIFGSCGSESWIVCSKRSKTTDSASNSSESGINSAGPSISEQKSWRPN